MKLISMTDYVLEQYKINQCDEDYIFNVLKYANFLKQPVTLGMFVPCDENGNVLEEPKFYFHHEYKVALEKYQKAKEKVLFNGFKIKDGLSISDEHSIFHPFWNYEGVWKISKGIKTIEDLIPYNINLAVSF